jgi:hypothetical protein
MIWRGLLVISAVGLIAIALDAIITGIKFKRDILLNAVE